MYGIEEFKTNLIDYLRKEYPESSFKLTTMFNYNSEREGITIVKSSANHVNEVDDVDKVDDINKVDISQELESKRISPIIYIDTVYAIYKKHGNFNDVTDYLDNCLKSDNHIKVIIDLLGDIKNNLTVRLLGDFGNKEFFEDTFNRDFLNLKEILYITSSNTNSCYSCKLNRSMIENNKDFSSDEIWEQAYLNVKQKGFIIKDLFSFVQEIKSFGESELSLPESNILYINDNYVNIKPPYSDMKDKLQRYFCDNNNNILDNAMYIISSVTTQFGANVLLFPDLLSVLAESLQSSFFVIPSSVHEIIIVTEAEHSANDYNNNVAKLNEMVKSVNTTLLKSDILSDVIYYFNKDTGKLSIV